MADSSKRKISRRTVLKGAAAAAAAAGAGGGAYWLGTRRRVAATASKRVIVIGIDGMDPRLSQSMIDQGLLPNLAKLCPNKGVQSLGTSIPPQSPVAWANFINGAGPGSHGIFDFLHRHPSDPTHPFFSAAETLPGNGAWEVGDYQLPLDFWPFNHQPPATVLRRQGVPFWNYLDEAGIWSTFYDLPSNYPPSPSTHGHHRCISGMGTPDMLGSYGTYQHFSEDGPEEPYDEGGGIRAKLTFVNETAKIAIKGPDNSMLKEPKPTSVEVLVHRDREGNTAALEFQGQRIMLKPGQWSPWVQLDFTLTTPAFLPSEHASGICRFFLQEVKPQVLLYVTPINIDPSDPAVQMSEPADFIQDVASSRGELFYTAGFQEDHKALSNGVFNDEEFIDQAGMVLEERLALLDYATDNYDDGLLYFYFSSTDMQSHMLWWDSDAPHPVRDATHAKECFEHVKRLYQRLDRAVGDLADRYRGATIIVMSDHGFANFARQFNVNSWLRFYGYVGPANCTSVLKDNDWEWTAAYGLGINGLYLNLKGREPHGVIEPGEEQEHYLEELTLGLESVRDAYGEKVIEKVHRADKVYSGEATALAPDLIIGFRRGYRASWATCLGDITYDVLLDNDSAWSADHCADASEVPGVLFCNRSLNTEAPSLIDLAPSILKTYGLPTPSSMEGKNLFPA